MVVSMHWYLCSVAGRTNQHKLSDINGPSQGLFTAQRQVSAVVNFWQALAMSLFQSIADWMQLI